MSDLSVFRNLLDHGGQPDRYYGVTIGIISSIADPQKQGRVTLSLPWLSESDETSWVRVLTPYGGKERGFFAPFQVGDEVLVAFEHGMIECPYVLGGLWNAKEPPPTLPKDNQNNLLMIKSRSGHTVTLDDTDGKESITIADKSGNQRVVFDAAKNTITISASADIVIESTGGKLKLSGNGIEIASNTDIKIEANTTMKLQALSIDLN
jgi:uncharacterized protein involved in type VI secretion and phage assembly